MTSTQIIKAEIKDRVYNNNTIPSRLSAALGLLENYSKRIVSIEVTTALAELHRRAQELNITLENVVVDEDDLHLFALAYLFNHLEEAIEESEFKKDPNPAPIAETNEDKIILLKVPASAWSLLEETLEMDSRSSAFDKELRANIETALNQVETITLPVFHSFACPKCSKLGRVLCNLTDPAR